MRRTSFRAIAGITALALAAGTSLLLAPPASAAEVVTAITSASASPTIHTGATNQIAGDLNLAALPAVAIGDTITISVDDADVTDNCAVPTDTVLFAVVPTVTTSTGAAIALTPTVASVGASCVAATSKDAVVLTATAAIPAGALVKVSGIRYLVGGLAAVGPVQNRIGAGALNAVNPNAAVSAVQAASAAPATLVPPSSQDKAIGSVVLVEQRPGAVGAGGACVTLTAPGGTTFEPLPLPTVAASGGNGVAGAVTATPASVSFVVTTPSLANTAYTINGLRVDTGATPGAITARVGSACGLSDIAKEIRLGYIGTVNRIQGSDRYATAAQIAAAQFGDLAGRTVVISRGDNFPDALSASYLAGKNNVPILLTAPTSVAPETVTALKFHGVTNVVLIGGTTAISTAVEQYLDALPTYPFGSNTANAATLTVTRVTGADRYATARNVAEFGGTPGTADPGIDGSCTAGGAVKTALLASGENFPDALSAGGLAYSGLDDDAPADCGDGGLPMLLTSKATLSGAASDAVTNLGIQQVIVLGGVDAIAPAVVTALTAAHPGLTAVRVAGATRQDTAVSVANMLGSLNIGEWDSGTFLVSRPDNFPDALTASSLSGRTRSPLYLTASPSALGATASNGIIAYPVFYFAGTLLGGVNALADVVSGQVATAIASQ